MDHEEDDFKPASEVFNTDFDSNFLSKLNSENENNNSAAPRESLYVKFDPLYKPRNTKIVNTASDIDNNINMQTPDEPHSHTPSSPNNSVSNNAPDTASQQQTGKLLDITFNSETSVEENNQPSVNNNVPDSVQDKIEPAEPQPRSYSQSELDQLVETAKSKERTQWENKLADQKTELLSQLHQKESEHAKAIRDISSDKETVVQMNQMNGGDNTRVAEKISAGYSRQVIDSVIAAREKSENMLAKHIGTLTAKNTEVLGELDRMHCAMSDLHKRYDNARAVINNMKTREDDLEEQIRSLSANFRSSEDNCRNIQQKCDEQLELASMRADQIKTESDAERIVMSASMKRLEMQITSLQAAFDDKDREAKELTAICDELLAMKQAPMEEDGESNA